MRTRTSPQANTTSAYPPWYRAASRRAVRPAGGSTASGVTSPPMSIGLPIILLAIIVIVALVYGLGAVFGRGARRGSR